MESGKCPREIPLLKRVKYSMGMERISSAPRLSFSGQDVFNLRNHNLSQLSRSTPGIYSPHRKLSQQRLNLLAAPKGILVKPKEELTPEKVEDEKEEKRSYYSLRLELQFTSFVFLCFILIIVIPLSMIVMGSAYVHQCPGEVMIPLFLIVGGSTFLSSMVLLRKLGTITRENYEDDSCYKRLLQIAVFFQTAWFIAGCYWIYGAYEPDYFNEESALFCNKTLYLYSFWLLNSIFLTLILFVVSFAVYILFGREQTQEIDTKV